MKFNQENDAVCIAEWRSMLNVFHAINEKSTDKTKDCNELKEAAKLSQHLTQRQLEGIIARCDNVINGSYGKTKDGIVFKTS